jgi:hypothetical protein
VSVLWIQTALTTYRIILDLLVLFVFIFVLALCLLLLLLVFLFVFTFSLLTFQLLLLFILLLDFFYLGIQLFFLLLGFYGGSFISIRLAESPVYKVSRTYIEEVLSTYEIVRALI